MNYTVQPHGHPLSVIKQHPCAVCITSSQAAAKTTFPSTGQQSTLAILHQLMITIAVIEVCMSVWTRMQNLCLMVGGAEFWHIEEDCNFWIPSPPIICTS